MTNRKRFAFQGLTGILLALILLGGCGGADTPFSLVDNNPSNNGQGLGGGGNTGGGSGGQGCAVQFTSTLILKAQVAPGSSDSADATGLITSEPKELPPMTLHLNGDQISMNGDDFQPVEILLGTQNVTVRQKAGTTATGTYSDEDGSISLDDVEFEITSPLEIPLPAFTFTTESTGDIHGNFGNLSAQGARLDKTTKRVTLVGGFQIDSFPLPEFVGAAVTVSFEGEVDTIPDLAHCTGGGASGVTFKEVVVDGDGHETEAGLGQNNTLSFDSVFVPQAGTDSPTPTDVRFYKVKKLRVKNQTQAAIGGMIGNQNGYTIAPSGSVSIPAGASQDFEITFGFAPVSDYSETNVPTTRTVSASLVFGSGTVNLAGDAKRAAPELTLVGTENNALSTVDLGIIPAPVLGSGTSAKLDCRPTSDRRIPVIAQKVSILNTGVRPLQIQHIHPPEDHVAQTADPYCQDFGSEFLRMSLSREGSATCQTTIVGGKTYLTDQCEIPPSGDGKVNFKVVYSPVNASPVTQFHDGQLEKDTGTLAIESNDPRFDASQGKTPFSLNLAAALSADQSSVLKIKKDGSTVEVPAGGNVRINIPNTTDGSVTQKLILLNRLDEPLNNVQITVEDTAHFEILTSPTPPPTTIPAQLAGTNTEPGHAEFFVKFTKPSGATSGAFPTTLRVRFIPNGSGVENTFEVSLVGSVNYQILTGDAQMTLDFISSFIDTPLLKSSPIDSLDFRKPQFAAFRPGTLRMNFQPVQGSESLRTVTLTNLPGIEPTNAAILNNLMALSKEDRKKLVRVYSTRLTGYSGGVEDSNHDEIPDCTEPDSIEGDYVQGKCSYFYYIFATKPGVPGTYNDDTGELVFANLDMRLLNPFHNSVLDYTSSLATNTALEATISTLSIDGKFAGDVPLVPDSSIGNADIAVPDPTADAIFSNPEFQCPGNWDPTDSTTPAFGCFISASSPHFLKGFSLRPLPNGDFSVVLTFLTRFGPAGPPGFVPSFMANGRIWVAIQGTLKSCAGGGCN
jgi:hypothetical protein